MIEEIKQFCDKKIEECEKEVSFAVSPARTFYWEQEIKIWNKVKKELLNELEQINPPV